MKKKGKRERAAPSLSDWDLVNGFATCLWNLTINCPRDEDGFIIGKDKTLFEEMEALCTAFRDEIMRRLGGNSKARYLWEDVDK